MEVIVKSLIHIYIYILHIFLCFLIYPYIQFVYYFYICFDFTLKTSKLKTFLIIQLFQIDSFAFVLRSTNFDLSNPLPIQFDTLKSIRKVSFCY